MRYPSLKRLVFFCTLGVCALAAADGTAAEAPVAEFHLARGDCPLEFRPTGVPSAPWIPYAGARFAKGAVATGTILPSGVFEFKLYRPRGTLFRGRASCLLDPSEIPLVADKAPSPPPATPATPLPTPPSPGLKTTSAVYSSVAALLWQEALTLHGTGVPDEPLTGTLAAFGYGASYTAMNRWRFDGHFLAGLCSVANSADVDQQVTTFQSNGLLAAVRTHAAYDWVVGSATTLGLGVPVHVRGVFLNAGTGFTVAPQFALKAGLDLSIRYRKRGIYGAILMGTADFHYLSAALQIDF